MADSRHSGLGHALIGVGGAALFGVPLARLVVPKDSQFAFTGALPLTIMSVGAAVMVLGFCLHFGWPRRAQIARAFDYLRHPGRILAAAAHVSPVVWRGLPRRRAAADAAAQIARKEAQELVETERAALQAQVANQRKAFEEKWTETEDLRGQLGSALNRIRELEREGVEKPRLQIRAVATMLGTELRDIRTKIERVKATNPPTYPDGFQLPGARFDEYEATLAEDPAIYEIVARAYTAAHHVNENILTRESRRTRGTRELLGAILEDGLEAAHGAAGEALDALGEPHNAPFRTPDQNAELGLVEPSAENSIQRMRSEIIVSQVGDDQRRAVACGRLIQRGFELKGEVRVPSLRDMTGGAVRNVLDGTLRQRLERWCLDSRGFIFANVYGTPVDLITEERESELLDEWTKNSIVEVIDSYVSILTTVKDSIPPSRLA